jgi:hypothetical protein
MNIGVKPKELRIETVGEESGLLPTPDMSRTN